MYVGDVILPGEIAEHCDRRMLNDAITNRMQNEMEKTESAHAERNRGQKNAPQGTESRNKKRNRRLPKLKIILAKSAGFCFGVRRAVELTEQTAAKVAESGSAAKVFTFGELIHNRDVVNRLREAGIAPIESLDEAQRGDYVIIRSHGVPKKIYEELETRGINFIDATCPFVSNIHRIVSAAYERGEQVFIVGNPEHPETIGINGHCGNSAIFIRGEEELRKLEGRSGCLVVQNNV